MSKEATTVYGSEERMTNAVLQLFPSQRKRRDSRRSKRQKDEAARILNGKTKNDDKQSRVISRKRDEYEQRTVRELEMQRSANSKHQRAIESAVRCETIDSSALEYFVIQ